MTDTPGPVERFRQSMVIGYDEWHDGIGYDLDAIAAADDDGLAEIETILLARGGQDWRDVEALAAVGSAKALAALGDAASSTDPAIRMAVLRHAPQVVSAEREEASVIANLQHAVFYDGLTQTLGHVESFHPPAVVDAVLQGALDRENEVAVHLAAMTMFIHGRAESSFDMEQRPFFLRFNTATRDDRIAVFRELCDAVGVDPAPYLARSATTG